MSTPPPNIPLDRADPGHGTRRKLLVDPAVIARMSLSRAKLVMGIVSVSIFAVGWNAISWVVFFRAISGPWRGGPSSLVPGLFVSPFLLVGLGMIAAVVYMVLSLFNPHAHARSVPESPRLGQSFQIEWELSPHRRTISTLRMSFQGQEIATSKRGTTTSSSRSVFFKETLFETREPLKMRGGTLTFQVAADTVPSFKSNSNAIVWSILIHGDIPRWPDLRAAIPVEILPSPSPANLKDSALDAPDEPIDDQSINDDLHSSEEANA